MIDYINNVNVDFFDDLKDFIAFIISLSVVLIFGAFLVGFSIKKMMQLLFKF